MLCTLHAGHNFWDYLFPGQDSFLFQDWLSTGGEEKEESACVCARAHQWQADAWRGDRGRFARA